MNDDRPVGPIGSRSCWVNCSAGVAGDMLLAGLIDAGADRMAVIEAWSRLDLDSFAATWEIVDRGGVSALWTNLVVASPHQHHDHHPDDDARQGGAATHHHRPAAAVIEMIERADLPGRVRRDAVRVYRALAAVEGAIHQQDPDEVELHEVGAVDSILDVVGVCAALDDLGIDDLSYSPVGLGVGLLSSAHGVLPHPAPATAQLLAAAQAPVTGIGTSMETATPTGVAVLTTLGVASDSVPAIDVTSVGYGAGTANPGDRANVVQVIVGTARQPMAAASPLAGDRSGDADDAVDPSAADDPGWRDQTLVLIETNVDDISGELIAYTIEQLIAAGALDAWATPILMKKGRPGNTVHALGLPNDLGRLRDVLAAETGSFGARVRYVSRSARNRAMHQVSVAGQPVRIKASSDRFKVEYDDAATLARATGRPLREIIAEAERLFRAEPPQRSGVDEPLG